ncbi:hypothetical protein FH972_009223 [Carpinus fangiana]|uniref:RING-type domain-containing protein n=1 Tax=Carpinus fangiana TaxID=176857 RepID=A0A5N6R3F9_9ROSI|nr:hypothetical protein FH972_009223 [Carpinus fangiana]
MGHSNFPGAAEGVLPVLVMNTVFSVALLKNAVRSVLQVVGASGSPPDPADGCPGPDVDGASETRISITHVNKSLWWASATTMECCVCLCGFEADEEVRELSCKHFFPRRLLEQVV